MENAGTRHLYAQRERETKSVSSLNESRKIKTARDVALIVMWVSGALALGGLGALALTPPLLASHLLATCMFTGVTSWIAMAAFGYALFTDE